MTILLPYPDNLITEYPGGARGHQGIDYGVPTGTPVLAAYDSVVRYVGDDGRGALTVDAVRRDSLLCRDGHLSRSFVSPGQSVKQGDLIALSGYSGYVLPPGPSGAHLHREFRWDVLWNGGRWLDWAAIMAQGVTYSISIPKSMEKKMIDSMFAVVDGVPSWCWLNWGTGKLHAVHTQKDADWIGGYMGSVASNFSRDKDGGTDRYKNKLALFKMLTK